MTTPFPPDPSDHRLDAWTDATPITDRDADALAAWLDRRDAPTGMSAIPAAPIGQNGQHASTAALPLTASAQQFHARLADAERAHAPEVPIDAIWEKVMSARLGISTTPPPPGIPPTRPTATPPPPRHPVRAMLGTHPAISASLVIALLIAIVAVFRAFNDDDSGKIIDYFPAFTDSGTAAATPNATEICQIPNAIVTTTVPGTRLYGPPSTPTASDAQAASAALTNVLACGGDLDAEETSARDQLAPFFTTRLLSETTEDLDQPQLSNDQVSSAMSLSTALAADPWMYLPYLRADEDDPTNPWPGQSPSLSSLPGGYQAVFAEDAIALPDGRVGVPVTLMVTDEDLWTELSRQRAQETRLYIFAVEDGALRIDEVLPLCIGDCDAFWADELATTQAQATVITSEPTAAPERVIEPIIDETATAYPTVSSDNAIVPTEAPSGGDNLRTTPVPTESSTATSGNEIVPAMTPTPQPTVATTSWRSPIIAAECRAPSASLPDGELAERAYVPVGTPSAADAEAVATQARRLYACFPTYRSVGIQTDRSQFETARFTDSGTHRFEGGTNVLQNPGIDDIYVRAPESVAASRENPWLTEYVEGGVIVSTEVFLPETAILLDDGRIAIPKLRLVADDESWDVAQQEIGQTTLLIWVWTGEIWKLDEEVWICVGNCRPSATPDASPIATPVADTALGTTRRIVMG